MRTAAVILLLLLAPSIFASSSRAFYQAYQNINYSLRSGKMQFSCDNEANQYRLQASFGSRAKLYWLSPAKEWLEIKDVVFTDTHISFESLGTLSGADVESLSKNINLPLFNRNYNNIPDRYFHKAQKSEASPYLFIIDMVDQISTASNIEALDDILMLNKHRYMLEQAYRSPVRTNDSGKLALQRNLAQERQQLLEAISLQYEHGIRVATPPFQHKIKSRCYL